MNDSSRASGGINLIEVGPACVSGECPGCDRCTQAPYSVAEVAALRAERDAFRAMLARCEEWVDLAWTRHDDLAARDLLRDIRDAYRASEQAQRARNAEVESVELRHQLGLAHDLAASLDWYLPAPNSADPRNVQAHAALARWNHLGPAKEPTDAA